MTREIYQERDLPWKDLSQIGLYKNGNLNLDKDDLKALLSGRRTEMLRLENLNTEGLHIPSLDAKLSVRVTESGKLELMLHPIYREPDVPQYLTDSEAEGLEKGKSVNIEKTIFDDEGKPKNVLVEFDPETNEFIVSDTDKIIAPDIVNSEPLSGLQKEWYRKGKQVQLQDGTIIQFSGTEPKGLVSNKLALVASILVDGGLSYILYQGLHALFGEKHNEQRASDYSQGYYDALAAMEAEEKTTSVFR